MYITIFDVFRIFLHISFTSYGKDTFSTISLLIDSLVTQKDSISKSVADFALLTFSQNLVLIKEQADELCDLLEERYRVTSIRGIDSILRRVELSIKGEREEDLLAEIIDSVDNSETNEEKEIDS